MIFKKKEYNLKNLYVCKFNKIVKIDNYPYNIESIEDGTAILAITEIETECYNYSGDELLSLNEMRYLKNEQINVGMIYRDKTYPLCKYNDNLKHIYTLSEVMELNNKSEEIFNLIDKQSLNEEIYSKSENSNIYKRVK